MPLRKLKLQRGALKAKLTRYNGILEDATNNDRLDIKYRQRQIEGILEEFEKVQLEIELADESEVSPDNKEREDFESKYFTLMQQTEELLVKREQIAESQRVTHVDSVRSPSSNTPPIKLPVINLPTFSGNYEDWLPFFDTFNSLIHNNETISDMYKFHYLKSVLRGSASALIDSLEISAANYNEAWQMLRERYDNKRIIVHRHIQAMHDLPAATKETFSAIRNILDGVLKHIRALTAMERPTQTWCDLLIFLVTSKLDNITVKEWESTLSSNELPTFKQLEEFLTKKCNTLETLQKSINVTVPSSNKTHFYKKASTNFASAALYCPLCKGTHKIYSCKEFLNLTIDDRLREVKDKGLCFNCLQPGHSVAKCPASNCRTCSRKHNSLLHMEKVNKQEGFKKPQVEASATLTTCASSHLTSQVLLSTAIIKVFDNKGNSLNCRALLDSGSQSNLITQELANKLKLPRRSTQIALTGITQGTTNVSEYVDVKIGARHNKFEANLDCLVLNVISGHTPSISLPKVKIAIPPNIQLADPDFHVSRRVDILIGADLFYKLLCIGQINIGKGQPTLQKTLFGWVVSGPLNKFTSKSQRVCCNVTTNEQLEANLTKFWDIEENYSQQSTFSPEEKFCENHFSETHERNAEGRFVVHLPIKQDAPVLGESRQQAEKRLYALERKLGKQPRLKDEYAAFLKEYLELGHMKLLSDNAISNESSHFYLPHHAVLKDSSTTTKLRVVFDGSAKSSSEVSLNDTLSVGPKLQQDLFEILARFRTFKFALTADIAKMYRQVLVSELETPLQRILWREDSSEPIKTYELTTLTYGTASASYLAIKALQQLATDEGHEHPIGAEIVKRDFYVDDLLTGANTLEEAKAIKDEVVEILSRGKFELRKWGSNCNDLLLSEDVENGIITEIIKNEEIRTLGLQWNTKDDIFQFCVQSIQLQGNVSKRKVLSCMSKIFDPLGLIAPFTIIAKLFMQKLWTLSVDWDESLSQELHTEWWQYECQLQDIKSIKIPRLVITIDAPENIEMHGFCDASERAYGACIYIRAVNKQGNISSHLLCSKSRVAPLKATSLPRLELCGAVLLARLMSKLANSLALKEYKTFYWTDSTIVLAWLQATSKTWKTFVANRVNEIQELSDTSNWRHVRTQDNPADLVSRGTSPTILHDSCLWWNGPEWLLQLETAWPTSVSISQHSDELLEKRTTLLTTETKIETDSIFPVLFQRYSSFNRTIRVLAYCLRFVNNLKIKITSNNDSFCTGSLTVDERNLSLKILLKAAQQQSFFKELDQLKRHGTLGKNNKLLALNPFLDKDGLIRVGGRLSQSNVPYQQKHQILLPSKHPLTELIVRQEHLKHFHAGSQATIHHIREKYWPLAAQNTVRSILRKCVTCFRMNPPQSHQIMGNLPRDRVTPARPFENSGVDYFGPLKIKEGRRKNSRIIKIYCAVFVCFATKAVHLELVGDLTTEAFLAALKRFMARRGKIVNLYSDNGTQFIGADRELKELRALSLSQDGKSQIQDYLAGENINWHFIPPRTPHFGGLWEAAVKSVKRHLLRVMGNTSLTYEEAFTLLTQIEAILNSRPLSPTSNDPNDLSVLTPAHFLIGGSLTSTVEPALTKLHVNSLSRWQYIQQVQQHFWKRWAKEYLSQLQIRGKWTSNVGSQLQPGALVLLRDDNLPPLHWRIGRIEEVFTGNDGVSRVATVKTARGILRRGASKLCVLPIE